MSGLDPRQLLELAVRPALNALGEGHNGVAAEQLVMGTAAVESGLVWLKQLGTGPALGLWQMEPSTHDDLWSRHFKNHELFALSISHSVDETEVAWNLRLGAAMCRLKYKDAKPKLPDAWDVAAMESYHKRFYNSALGATKPGEFTRAWANLIAPQAARMWP